MIDRILLRFGLVGGFNTVLGLGVIFIARQYVDDFFANLIGYLLVVPISFFAHRDLSFRDRGKRLPAFLRYLVMVVVGYILNVAVLRVALKAGNNPYFAQGMAIGTYVLTTYVISRYLVFRRSR